MVLTLLNEYTTLRIERQARLTDGKCKYCSTPIPGVWTA